MCCLVRERHGNLCSGKLLVDEILYSILGQDKTRIDIATLCHPAKSPLKKCQDQIVEMMSNWGAFEQWPVLHAIGVDFDNDTELWLHASPTSYECIPALTTSL